MVCDKCEKKLSKVACPNPKKWDDSSKSAGGKSTAKEDSHGRKLGENKLLGKAKRYQPYAKATKCKICKSTLHQDGIYCQACAYAKGLCSMCGKQILDTSAYKQSTA